MSKIIMFCLFILYASLTWADQCKDILAKLSDLVDKKVLPKRISINKVGNFDRAITKPMSKSDWKNAKKNIFARMKKFSTDTQSSRPPIGFSKLPPPKIVEIKGQDGYFLKGARYFSRTTGKGATRQKDIFRMDFKEKIYYKDGEAVHYVSVNINKYDPIKKEFINISYVDSPHIDRLGAKWFHAHDATIKDAPVIENLTYLGYSESVIENVFHWAKQFAKQHIESFQ